MTGRHTPPECRAQITARNEDGGLICDLQEGHLGDHWDPEYGMNFRTPFTDPH